MKQFIEDNEKAREIGKISFDDTKYTQPTKSTKRGITNKRQTILKDFIDAINLERRGTKFPEIKKGRSMTLFCMKIAHLNESELEHFYSMCKDYKQKHGSFSKCFYGALK